MIGNGHEVEFLKQENSIKLKGTDEKINSCKEGRLLVLGLWVQAPVDAAWTNRFVQQVAQA